MASPLRIHRAEDDLPPVVHLGVALHVVRLSDVETEPVQWVWPGRLPVGKLVILDGDPGVGKSMLTLAIAACITAGSPLPDGYVPAQGDVMFVAMEDGIADTIRPRAEAAGADMSRIHVLDYVGDEKRPLQLPDDAGALRRWVEDHNIRMLVIDPITSHLGRETDSYRDTDVRRALLPLAQMAADLGVLVVVVRHLTKKQNGSAVRAGAGSMAFAGLARLVLMVGRDPDNADRRILAVSKSNLGKFPESVAFTTVERNGAPMLQWEGTSTLSADQLVTERANEESGERFATKDAVEWLRDHLADGPKEKRHIISAAKTDGTAARTIERAAERLEAKGELRRGRTGFGRTTVWELITQNAATSPIVGATNSTALHDGSSGMLGFPVDDAQSRQGVDSLATGGECGENGSAGENAETNIDACETFTL